MTKNSILEFIRTRALTVAGIITAGALSVASLTADNGTLGVVHTPQITATDPDGHLNINADGPLTLSAGEGALAMVADNGISLTQSGASGTLALSSAHMTTVSATDEVDLTAANLYVNAPNGTTIVGPIHDEHEAWEAPASASTTGTTPQVLGTLTVPSWLFGDGQPRRVTIESVWKLANTDNTKWMEIQLDGNSMVNAETLSKNTYYRLSVVLDQLAPTSWRIVNDTVESGYPGAFGFSIATIASDAPGILNFIGSSPDAAGDVRLLTYGYRIER